MSKKNILIALIIIFISNFMVYSGDLSFIAIDDASIYKLEASKKTVGIIRKGSKCKSLGEAFLQKYGLRIEIEYNGITGWVNADKLRPFQKSKSFNSDILLGNKELYWTLSYYQEVIRSRDLKQIVDNEPHWFDNIYDNDAEALDFFFIPNVFFYDSVILITNAYFLVEKIKKANNNYYIDARLLETEQLDNKMLNQLYNFNGKKLSLILKIDGDYMDIYINDEKTKLIELIKVDKNFVDSLYKVVKQESVDLSKIDWPHRANKEQPEEDTTTKASKKNYYTPTVNRLRFRATPTLDGRFIRYLKAGERLELIERGKTETIGDAKGTWVKVKTKQGEVGWCFDAYLKEVK